MTRALLTSAEAAAMLGIPEAKLRSFVEADLIHQVTARSPDGRLKSGYDAEEADTIRSIIEEFQAKHIENGYSLIALPPPAIVVAGVYFVKTGDFIKIGYGSNIASRLLALQCANPQPLQLMHWERGSMSDERAFHKRFEHQRTRGEWFSFDGELLDYVKRRTAFLWGFHMMDLERRLAEAEGSQGATDE